VWLILDEDLDGKRQTKVGIINQLPALDNLEDRPRLRLDSLFLYAAVLTLYRLQRRERQLRSTVHYTTYR